MPEVESRTQGSRPRPRTQKPRPRPRTAFPRTDTLEAKNRNARGQGHKHKCSPTKKKGLHKNFSGDLQKKKKVFTKIFLAISTKNVFQKIFQALHKILTFRKIVLSSSRGQANFRGLEALRPRPRTSKCVLEAKDVLEDSTSGYGTSSLLLNGSLMRKAYFSFLTCCKIEDFVEFVAYLLYHRSVGY